MDDEQLAPLIVSIQRVQAANVSKVLTSSDQFGQFVNRSPLLYVTIITLVDTPGRGPEACTVLMKIYTYGILTAIFTAEAVLTLRIWAIYLRSRTVGVMLLVIYSGITISVFITVGLLLDSIKFAGLPFPNGPTCFVVAADRKLVLVWFVLAAYDAFQCILLAYQAYRAFAYGGKSKLVNLIYKDGADKTKAYPVMRLTLFAYGLRLLIGIIYYVCMMAMSMVGMIVILSLPPEYLRVTAGPTQIIHTSLTARVVLHARQLTARQSAGLTAPLVETSCA
ncbi:hypothetical protein AMATHDRAFT_6680 [Amanita thiersii Skay4041]|uniref:G-protein coupled receptors family 1 profile domain-containing protein n=1 Tax=Amanita thiersii Skay4041 TaxID=703135 RepID=A0A2A9NIG9_9AGAR|nr:hypothetical protein AMATHDRAFT_6680 [Amanita thiersii Skay4041]